MMDIVGCCALVGTGVMLSLIGGGGSMLSLPILVYLFSLDVVSATSYSLFLVGTTSLLGAWLKRDQQHVDKRAALVFACFSLIATFTLRRWVIPLVPDEVTITDQITLTKRLLIMSLFALLSTISAGAIFLKPAWQTGNDLLPRTRHLIYAGLVTGTLAGFMGIGGGFLILPALILFARLPFNVAVGTTLLIIGCNSLLGFLGDVINRPIDWMFLTGATALALMGMVIGDFFSKIIPAPFLRISFAWSLLVVAIAVVIAEWVGQ
jgi:uncharacterized membrane protein YfcA